MESDHLSLHIDISSVSLWECSARGRSIWQCHMKLMNAFTQNDFLGKVGAVSSVPAAPVMAWNLFQERKGEKLWLMKVKFPRRNHNNTWKELGMHLLQCYKKKKSTFWSVLWCPRWWKIDAQIDASRCISWQPDRFFWSDLSHQGFFFLQTVSVYKYTNSSQHKLSSSPHEFNMNSHISVAFLNAVSMYIEEGTQRPGERSLPLPDSDGVCPVQVSLSNCFKFLNLTIKISILF